MNWKWIKIVLTLVVICLAAAFAVPPLLQFPVIGRVYGAENELIEIDGVTYGHKTERPYVSGDRGRYLGSVENDKVTMRVFDVKGDESDHWIFALWDWEGYFYCRTQEE